MLKIRRLLLSFVLLIFNIINFSVLLSNIDDDYTNIFITLFYAQFKKIVALSNLIQRIYRNDIRNRLP